MNTHLEKTKENMKSAIEASKEIIKKFEDLKANNPVLKEIIDKILIREKQVLNLSIKILDLLDNPLPNFLKIYTLMGKVRGLQKETKLKLNQYLNI